MRDLFNSFARPSDEAHGEPCLEVSDLEALLRALGERPSRERLERLVKKCDIDNSGTIELDEFLQGRARILKHEDSGLGNGAGDDALGDLDLMVEAFRTLDTDGTGVISVDDITGLLSTAGGHVSREEAEAIVAAADANGDGVVDLDEFIDLVTSESKYSWRLRSGFRVALVIGGPGSGKGTLCERLIEEARIDHISSGDLLR